MESELNSKWEETKSNQRQIRTLEIDCVSKQREIINLQAKCDGLVRSDIGVLGDLEVLQVHGPQKYSENVRCLLII